MVIFSVMAEYALFKVRAEYLVEAIKEKGGIMAGIGDVSPGAKHQKQENFAHLTVGVGTFIWGFGDLFIVNSLFVSP